MDNDDTIIIEPAGGNDTIPIVTPSVPAGTSKALVPIRDAGWDAEVKDVLRDVIRINRTKADGHRAEAYVRSTMGFEAAQLLERLVARMERRLGIQ